MPHPSSRNPVWIVQLKPQHTVRGRCNRKLYFFFFWGRLAACSFPISTHWAKSFFAFNPAGAGKGL